jgi:3-phenylpropionate/trans-cinnamate dioxygenase ferredoxin reductase component
MTPSSELVIVGAGQAGSELALSARQQGWTGSILLLGDEPELPYQRPPLSKAYLCGASTADALVLRQQAAYDSAQITLRLGARMTAIDRQQHEITLQDGTRLAYDKLALCTGGRARPFVCPGFTPDQLPTNLYSLRTKADADAIGRALVPGRHLVVIGGGYVGLEVAASARKLGAQVTLLEAQPRILARVAGETLSDFMTAAHRAAGVTVITGASVESVICENGAIVRVNCSNGQTLSVDTVVAGVGMLPNIEAAQVAGLAGALGIEVDACSTTVDPDIVAAGDCTVHFSELYGRQIRLESVPNALEQARSAAAALCGKSKPNHSVPWFWSDQYDLKLQLAGLAQGFNQSVLRGDPQTNSFCVFYLQGKRLLAVDAVNRPVDFMLVRRALASAVSVDASQLADESIPLKQSLAPA